MVKNRTSCEPLNHEIFIGPALIVGHRELDYSRLDDDHAVNNVLFSRAIEIVTLVVGASLHVAQDLLLGDHRQVFEILDLVALHFKECSQIVLVLEDVLLKADSDVRELLFQLFKAAFGKFSQGAIVTRLDRRRSLRIIDQADLTEVVSVIQLLLEGSVFLVRVEV